MKTKINSTQEIWDLLINKSYSDHEVTFDGKISTYVIILNDDNSYSYMRVQSWNALDEVSISVKEETVLKRWNEVYDIYGEYRV